MFFRQGFLLRVIYGIDYSVHIPNRHYHDKFCIDRFSILTWTNLVISRNYEFTIMNFVINISQYVKTKNL